MSVSKNATYNIIGASLPSVLTLVTVPLYLHVVGVARYGLLTLCWVILGYSGFLDFGLGQAIARRVATLRDGDPRAIVEIVWTGVWLSLLTGTIAALAVYAGALVYFGHMAHVSPDFRLEMTRALPLLAASVPVVMLGSALGGVLVGRERFLAINGVSAFGQTLVSLMPLLVAYLWKPDLQALIAGALVGRALPLPVMYWLCRQAVSLPPVIGRPSRPLAKELLGFGGWLALTTFAHGVINTCDRLAIGSTIGAAAVSAYGIAYGVVSRIILVPHSLSAALYPRFAYAEEHERDRLMSSSLQAVAVLISPVIILLVGIAQPFFMIWIGPALAATAAPVAYVLAGGFWLYCLGHMAYSMVQATGHPERVAKLLVSEIIPYCAALYLGMRTFGLVGAAGAFTLRAGVDCFLQMRLARVSPGALKRLIVPAGLMLASVITATTVTHPVRYVIFLALFAVSITWSLAHIPDVLRPVLHRVGAVPGFRWILGLSQAG